MEEQKPKPTLFVPYTKEQFEAKLAAINAGSKILWGDKADNYCNPLIDVDGVYWMIVSGDFVNAFTAGEMEQAVELEEIPLLKTEK